jgi:hypothetical protein
MIMLAGLLVDSPFLAVCPGGQRDATPTASGISLKGSACQ